MKKVLAFIFALMLAGGGFAQTGIMFPSLSGETLENKVMNLPESCLGKMTLVGMAYSKKAEEALKSWYQPVSDKFIAKLGIFDSKYDVNVVFVPMYIGLKQTAYDATMKELKQSNRRDLFPYLLFYKGEIEPYGSVLKMDDKSSPYFFLLDENGKILYSTKGFYTDKKMEEIEEFLEFK